MQFNLSSIQSYRKVFKLVFFISLCGSFFCDHLFRSFFCFRCFFCCFFCFRRFGSCFCSRFFRRSFCDCIFRRFFCGCIFDCSFGSCFCGHFFRRCFCSYFCFVRLFRLYSCRGFFRCLGFIDGCLGFACFIFLYCRLGFCACLSRNCTDAAHRQTCSNC